MDKYQRRMLQKRDEYTPNTWSGISKNEKMQSEIEYRERWLDTMNRWKQERPYLIKRGTGSDWELWIRSKFPQRYPEYDRVIAQVFEGWKKRQTLRHCRMIKEELMMTCWHPDRLEKMLEQGYEFD